MSIERRLTVAGIGSLLSRDDAIGLELVRDLPTPSGVETLLWEDADALTLAHELLQLATPVLIVDCADMRLAPGSWRAFSLDDAGLAPATDAVSTHGLGLAEALAIARQLGFGQTLRVFGVQPYDIRSGAGLSAAMAGRLGVLRQALGETVAGLLPAAA